MEIITQPNSTLRQVARELKPEEFLNSEFKKFATELIKTMLVADGLGLAAPQVNKSIRVIALNVGDQPQIYINPKILKKSWRKNIMEEGCLSVPGVWGNVKRPIKVVLEYTDLNGQNHKIKVSDLPARVFQHEIDHLDGVLFIDKILKK